MGALVVYYSPYAYELFSRETRKVSHWYFSDYQMGKSQNTSGDLGFKCWVSRKNDSSSACIAKCV